MATINFSGTLDGSGEMTGTMLVIHLLGGQSYGFGTLTDSLLVSWADTASGSGELTGSMVVGVSFLSYAFGQGNLNDSVPLPARGFGTLSGFFVVQKVPPPFCRPAASVPTFGYMERLTEGGLILRISDGYGNLFSPSVVNYALFEVLRGGYKQLRGPAKRTPVMKADGSYYATGVAGECGQPGNWVIVWTWQRYPGAPSESRCDSFVVQDALARAPCDTNRKRKFGWNC